MSNRYSANAQAITADWRNTCLELGAFSGQVSMFTANAIPMVEKLLAHQPAQAAVYGAAAGLTAFFSGYHYGRHKRNLEL